MTASLEDWRRFYAEEIRLVGNVKSARRWWRPLRERLRRMSDQELRRFGEAPRFMCSPGVNFNKPPLSRRELRAVLAW